MDFIKAYKVYSSGNMSPERYHRWCALSILGMAVGRKLYVDHGYYRIHPTLYITLVGRQGLRKTTAKDLAKNMFLEAYPGYPIGASVTTREKIVERMSSEACLRSYTDETGTPHEHRPLGFFVNELKNFMSYNPSGMVEFLTDIYDSKFFDADTLKHGLKPIINPYLTILACETPAWIIDKLKLNIIAGGFSRRMLYIYVTERPPRITFPVVSKEAKDAEEYCKAHLKKLDKVAGGFTWEPEAKVFFDQWFKALPEQVDEVLAGYYEAKDVLAQKVAMLLAAAQDKPRFVFTVDLLKVAIAFLEEIEDNLPKLTIAAGRNELAIHQQALMEMLENQGGKMHEVEWMKRGGKEMGMNEYEQMMKFFLQTQQVFKWTKPGHPVWVMNKKVFIEYQQQYGP